MKLYNLEKFFMLRVTQCSLHNMIDVLHVDKPDFIINKFNDNIIKEAISISSSDFALFLDKNKKGNESPLTSKDFSSLIGYSSRIFARATPFGFFAGITNGSFGDNTKLQNFEKVDGEKILQSDLSWIYSVIRLLENHDEILNQLYVINNKNCYVVNGRYKNPYVSDFGQSKLKKNQSNIKYTKLLELVISITDTPIIFRELLTKIKEQYEGVPDNVVYEYLKELVQFEYLLTEFRKPLFAHEPLDYINIILSRLSLHEELDNIRRDLTEIAFGLREYNNSKNVDILKHRMSKIESNKDYINGLFKIETVNLSIGKNIYNELNEFIDILSQIAYKDNESPFIKKYKEMFIERYGTTQEIKLLELFDSDIGIGNPYIQKLENSHKEDIIDEYMENKIIMAITSGKNEVELTNQDFGILKQKLPQRKLPRSSSVDLCVKIIAPSIEKINDGNYKIIIGENIGSYRGAAHYNRFSRILNDELKNDLNEFYLKIKILNKDILLVDTKELPQVGRISNVDSGNLNFDYLIAPGLYWTEENNIDFNDILIGYDDKFDLLYAKSKKYNKVLNVVSDSMLSPMANNHYIRFLRELTIAGEVNPNMVINSFRKEYAYVPQIRYKNVVLIPETWQLSTMFIRIDSFENFLIDFNKVKEELRISKYVYLSDGDHCVVCNTNNTVFIEYLYRELKLKGKCKIRKYEYQDDIKSWLSCGENSYANECIFTFTLNVQEPDFKLTSKNYTSYSLLDSSRVKDLSDDWLYIKIYVDRELSKEYIIRLYSLFNDLYDNKIIDTAFYIQYADSEGFHLRIRLHALKERRNDLLSTYLIWLNKVDKKLKYKNYVIDTYSRELERYGGINAIERAEKVFSMDSLYTIELIRHAGQEQPNMDLVGFYSCFNILIIFMKTIDEIYDNLSKNISAKENRKEYRKHKELIEKYMNNPTILDNDTIKSAYIKRENELVKYSNLLMRLKNKNELTNTYENIALSIVHMFCNRYNSTPTWERKIMSYIRHFCYDMIQKRNNFEKEKN